MSPSMHQTTSKRELLPRGRRHRDALPDELPADLASLATHADAALVLQGPVISDASPSVVDLLGWDPRLCLGRTMREVFDDGWSQVSELQDQAAAAVGHVAVQSDVRMVHVDGAEVWVDVMVADRPEERVTLVLLTDVTDRHAEAAAVARSDDLDGGTGLPNRQWLIARTEQAMTAADQRGDAVVVISVRLPAGDPELVTTAAARLVTIVRADDRIACVGPHEFAVLLRRLDPAHLNAAIDDVTARIGSAVAIGPSAATIGVAVHLPPGHRGAFLLESAERRG
jgi:PAS domain S-box-containing protein